MVALIRAGPGHSTGRFVDDGEPWLCQLGAEGDGGQ